MASTLRSRRCGLVYITVADLDESLRHCRELGGTLIAGPKDMGSQGRYCVIRDPAGAPVALFECGPRQPDAVDLG